MKLSKARACAWISCLAAVAPAPTTGDAGIPRSASSTLLAPGESAWLRAGTIPKDAECAPLSEPHQFFSYARCRYELKSGLGTSIKIVREWHGTGYDASSRWIVLISLPPSQLHAGKWELPAPGVQVVYSNCEQSWAHLGCYVSARASGTLELRDVSEASATVILDAIFLPDRWGRYPPEEREAPKPERFTTTVVARP